MEKWCDRTTKEWVRLFIHALGSIPIAWYLDAELHQRTCHWETLKDEFLGIFGLARGTKVLEKALQDIDTFVFDESCPSTTLGTPTSEMKM